MVGDLAFIWLVGPVVLHGTGPETAVDFIARHDLLRFFSQDQHVLEAGRLQFDRTAPVEKELLAFVHEDDRWIGDQIPKILDVSQAGVKRGKQRCIPKDVGHGAGQCGVGYPSVITGVASLTDLTCRFPSRCFPFRRVFRLLIVLVEIAVELFCQVLGQQLFQFDQGQLSDGLGCVVAFGDEAVDVGPAQDPEADLREGKALFGDAVDQPLRKSLDPGDGPRVPADLPGQGRQGFGQPTEVLPHALDGAAEHLVAVLDLFRLRRRDPPVHHQGLLDGPLLLLGEHARDLPDGLKDRLGLLHAVVDRLFQFIEVAALSALVSLEGDIDGDGVMRHGQEHEYLEVGDVPGVGVVEEFDEEDGGLQGDPLGGGVLSQGRGDEPVLGGLLDEAPFDGKGDGLLDDLVVVGVGHLGVPEGPARKGALQEGLDLPGVAADLRGDEVQDVPVHLPAVQGGGHLLDGAFDVVVSVKLVIHVGGGDEERPAEVGDEAVAGHPAAHVLIVGNEDALLGEAACVPEILPAERRDDGVLHGEVEPHGQGGGRAEDPDLSLTGVALDDVPLLPGEVCVVDGDAGVQEGDEHVPGDALFQAAHLGDGAGGGREAQAVAEVMGQGLGRGLVGEEDDRLLALVFREKLGRFHVLPCFPFGLEREPALFTFETAVEFPVAELAVEKDALAKLHGALVFPDHLGPEPLSQGLAFPQDSGEPHELGLFRIQKDPREEDLQDGSPFLISQVLQLIHEDEADVVDELGVADQKRMELLVDDDGDVEPAAFDALIVLPAVVGGDNGLDAGLFVVLVELLEFFFRQGLGGNEVENPLALAAVVEGEDLADEGLSGGGDGGEEEVAAVQDLIFLEGQLLDGEELCAVFLFQDGDDVRVQPEGFQEVDAHGVNQSWFVLSGDRTGRL